MVNTDNRGYEYPISFTPDQMERLSDGRGFVIRGASIKKSRPHRHEMPSAYCKHKKKHVRKLLTLDERRKWSEWW